MAFAWARKGETPRKVAIHFTQDRDAMDIRVATDKDDPNNVFDTTQLGDLWLTLQGSGYNLRSPRILLTGKDKDADGKPVRIEPEIVVDKNGKSYGYAYTEKQLKAFGVPQNIHLMSGNYGAPLLIVGQLPYEGRQRNKRETPTIVRMTAKPAGEPPIQRRKAS